MKGNSERVPNKNIRLLNGKPVCHWILEALSRSKYIDEIITRSKTLFLRKEIVMSKSYQNLQAMMQEQNAEKRIEKACETFRYVYEHKEAFNKLADKAIFLKTVYKKALEFYKDDGFALFYEWIFKFRNYIALIDKNFLYYSHNIIIV